MVATMQLWLPILLSAVAVFMASSLVHMVLKYHNTDYGKLPAEDAIMDALRPHALPPGQYAFPHSATPEDMKDPAYQEKMNRGPVGILTMWPTGPMQMGRTLGIWFVYLLVVGLFVAYLAAVTLPPGTEYMHVFRVTGTGAFMAYALGQWIPTVWFHVPVSTTLKNTFDSLLYALVTAGVFGWLWPGA